jgi:guanylate kinase
MKEGILGFECQKKKMGGGLVFIISAPSGAGKTTLVKKVMEQLPGLQFSISYTTRSPRVNEKNGKDYHFVSSTTFQQMVERGEFLESAEVLGNFYGTTQVNIKELESAGLDLILDIDTQGARKVLKKFDQATLIYILPPSLEVLQERLVKRGLDTPEMIQFRLDNVGKDIQEASWYHYVFINERIEDAIEKLKAIIIAERCRKDKKLVLKEKKKEWEGYHGENYGRGLFEKGGESV